MDEDGFESAAEAREYGLDDGYHDGIKGSKPNLDLIANSGRDYQQAYQEGYQRGRDELAEASR